VQWGEVVPFGKGARAGEERREGEHGMAGMARVWPWPALLLGLLCIAEVEREPGGMVETSGERVWAKHYLE
jgi:hypothetical protein